MGGLSSSRSSEPDARDPNQVRRSGNETGAAALEFAIVFPVFFFLFYSLITWGVIFGLQQSMSLAAQEGARAAVAVSIDAFIQDDGTFDQDGYDAAVATQALAAVAGVLGWLPGTWKNPILDGNVDVAVTPQATPFGTTEYVVDITVRYPAYSTQPILPVLTFPVVGDVPPVPKGDLVAQAVTRL